MVDISPEDRSLMHKLECEEDFRDEFNSQFECHRRAHKIEENSYWPTKSGYAYARLRGVIAAIRAYETELKNASS